LKPSIKTNDLSPKQILANVEQGKAEPIYYLYGDEPFKLREFTDKFQDAFLGEQADRSFSVDRLDGSVCSVSEIIDTAATTGFLFSASNESAGRRLVFVRQAQSLKNTEKLLPWCEEQRSVGGGSSVVLLLGDSLDGRKKLHQWFRAQGLAVEFKKAADRELVQWAQYLAKKRGITLSGEAVESLAFLCDGSLNRLDQEIEKAWLYRGGSAGIELAARDVAAVASQDVSHEMADFVAAVLEGKRVRALLSCGKVVRSAEDALGFVGFCVWAIKNPERFRSTGSLLRRGQVQTALLGLERLDRKLKSSGAEPQSLLNEFILQVTE